MEPSIEKNNKHIKFYKCKCIDCRKYIRRIKHGYNITIIILIYIPVCVCVCVRIIIDIYLSQIKKQIIKKKIDHHIFFNKFC